MKAAYIHRPGPPESIVYGELPTPVPGPHQALVKVAAVAVNPIDTYLRGGAIPMNLPWPYIVGCDLAGTVEALGPGASRVKVGDRVWGSNQGLLGRQGTFAQYAAVQEAFLYPTPPNVGDADAAAAALVGITAHLGLRMRAGLKPGETLLVNGGAGGVGSMVVQMAKAIGGRVIATAGSDARVTRARDLGADFAVNYRTCDVVKFVKDVAPEGVDVFWETRREPDFDAAVALMAPWGRMILMAGRAARPPFPVGPFYVKGCALLGFAMFQVPPEEQRRAAEEINTWLAAGRIKAVIDRVFPLSAAAAAHRLQEDNTLNGAGTLAGKIVLEV